METSNPLERKIEYFSNLEKEVDKRLQELSEKLEGPSSILKAIRNWDSPSYQDLEEYKKLSLESKEVKKARKDILKAFSDFVKSNPNLSPEEQYFLDLLLTLFQRYLNLSLSRPNSYYELFGLLKKENAKNKNMVESLERELKELGFDTDRMKKLYVSTNCKPQSEEVEKKREVPIIEEIKSSLAGTISGLDDSELRELFLQSFAEKYKKYLEKTSPGTQILTLEGGLNILDFKLKHPEEETKASRKYIILRDIIDDMLESNPNIISRFKQEGFPRFHIKLGHKGSAYINIREASPEIINQNNDEFLKALVNDDWGRGEHHQSEILNQFDAYLDTLIQELFRSAQNPKIQSIISKPENKKIMRKNLYIFIKMVANIESRLGDKPRNRISSANGIFHFLTACVHGNKVDVYNEEYDYRSGKNAIDKSHIPPFGDAILKFTDKNSGLPLPGERYIKFIDDIRKRLVNNKDFFVDERTIPGDIQAVIFLFSHFWRVRNNPTQKTKEGNTYNIKELFLQALVLGSPNAMKNIYAVFHNTTEDILENEGETKNAAERFLRGFSKIKDPDRSILLSTLGISEKNPIIEQLVGDNANIKIPGIQQKVISILNLFGYQGSDIKTLLLAFQRDNGVSGPNGNYGVGTKAKLREILYSILSGKEPTINGKKIKREEVERILKIQNLSSSEGLGVPPVKIEKNLKGTLDISQLKFLRTTPALDNSEKFKTNMGKRVIPTLLADLDTGLQKRMDTYQDVRNAMKSGYLVPLEVETNLWLINEEDLAENISKISDNEAQEFKTIMTDSEAELLLQKLDNKQKSIFVQKTKISSKPREVNRKKFEKYAEEIMAVNDNSNGITKDELVKLLFWKEVKRWEERKKVLPLFKALTPKTKGVLTEIAQEFQNKVKKIGITDGWGVKIVINSTLRPFEYNKNVFGASPNSPHQTGTGFDIARFQFEVTNGGKSMKIPQKDDKYSRQVADNLYRILHSVLVDFDNRGKIVLTSEGNHPHITVIQK